MPASNRISSAFVAVGLQGLSEVRTGLQNIKAVVADTAKPFTVHVDLEGVDAAKTKLTDLKSSQVNVPVTATGIPAIKTQVDNLKGKPVEIPFVASGLATVTAAVTNMKSPPLAVQLVLDARKAMADSTAFLSGLKEQLSSSPAMVTLSVRNEATAVVAAFKAQLEGLPATKKVEFIADALQTVNAQIADLRKQLDATPGDKTIAIKLQGLEAARKALQEAGKEIVTIPLLVNARAAQADVAAFLASLKEQLSASPAMVKLGIDNQASQVVSQLKAQLAGLPANKRVAILAEGLAATKQQIADLQAQLAKLPNSKTIKVQLQAAQGVAAGLQKEINSVNTEGLQGKFAALGSSIANIGRTAAIGFGAATAAIGKLVAVADPVGFNLLQVKFAQLSVQIGSIFLPILTKVTGYVDKVLQYFRSLSQEQRQNIERWTEVGLVVLGVGAALAAIATVVSPIIGLMSSLGSVISVIGPMFAAVSGSIGSLVGALGGIAGIVGAVAGPLLIIVGACVAVAAAVMALNGEFNESFANMYASVKPILASLASVFQSTMDMVGNALRKLLPVFEGLVETLAPIIGVFINIFGGIISAIKPVFDVVVDIVAYAIDYISGILTSVGGFIDFLSDAFSGFGDTVGSVFGFIIEALRPVGSVFAAIFGAIKSAIDIVIKTLIYLGTLLAEFAKGNFISAFGTANDAVDKYDKKVKDQQEAQDKRAEDRKNKTGKETKPTQDVGRQVPMQQEYKISYTSFLDAYKQAQVQAGKVMTPAEAATIERNKVGKEQLDEAKKTNAKLDKLNNKKDTDATGSGTDF